MYSQLLSAIAFAYLGTAVAAPTSWYHAPDSDIAALFKKRAPSPDDPNFASNYPAGWVTPPASSLPKEWTDKLASIQLPDVAVSQPNNGYPQYPNNESGASEHICSFTYECTQHDDLVSPPDGIIAVSFDDGPTAASPTLNQFLRENNIADKVTHFMIGGNILGNPKEMQVAANAGGHIGVHTWSHAYMTTLSNEGVLAELGWTMQIISDLHGGRIPKYWRPPYGDVDNRVRAIAKGVFGLETVPWSHDSADWAISTGGQSRDEVMGQMNGWLTGPKSPGLNILEHESHDSTVDIFVSNYPKMVSNGWDVRSVADAWSMDWYVNSANNDSPVTSMAVAAGSFIGSASTNATSTSAQSGSSASNSESQTSTQSQTQSQSQTSSSGASSATQSASSTRSAGSNVASPSTTGAAGRSATVSGWIIALVGLTGAAFI